MTSPRNESEPEAPAALSAPVGEGSQAPTHSTEALDDFARGTIDALRQICASLIGRDALVAEDLQAHMCRLADFWRAKGVPRRSEPAHILSEALEGMAKERREVAANIFPPNKGMN
jgi:hypothetical protein